MPGQGLREGKEPRYQLGLQPKGFTDGKKIGKQTVVFHNRPVVLATASVAGPKEGKGPLGRYYDIVKEDTLFGERTWEKAEARLLEEAANLAVKKANLKTQEVDYLLAGDLLNQLIASNLAAREISIPFLGLYGACATMSEALTLAAVLVDGRYGKYALAAASSHHDSAERQYRYPTEMGNQRPPTAQWTVTGAGAALVGASGEGPVITCATVGTVVDIGLKDPNDMGSAMAPAAAETIWQHFQDTGRKPEDYDLIATGDLASVGKGIALDLLKKSGFHLGRNYTDCGVMVYDPSQDVQAGASGCGCSAIVFAGYLMKELAEGRIQRLLLVATGALLSPTSYQQGESIPCIAHAVAVENQRSVKGGAGIG